MSQIRAAQLKEDLLALASLGNELATRVIADLDARTLRRIASATRVDWLPVELNVELALLRSYARSPAGTGGRSLEAM